MGKSCYSTKIAVKTGNHTDLVDITPQLQQFVTECGVKSGVVLVMHMHTTAGLVMDSIGDPNTRLDMKDEIDRIAPTRVDFKHQFDTPRDASGHIKSMLIGQSVMVPIEDGKLPGRRSSGVMFFEFDGPRDRTVYVQIWSADDQA